MEFAQLIAPGGPWNIVWLAAHWDKRLKKQDYDDLDLRCIVASYLEQRGLISLRAIGHLVLGACKIFEKKCTIFDNDTQEVQMKLMMAFSAEDRHEVPTSEVPAADITILKEVNLDEIGAIAPEAILRGKRHMARLEDITLKEAPLSTLESMQKDEMFPSATVAEIEAAMAKIRKSVGDSLQPFPDLDCGDFDTQPLVFLDQGVHASTGGQMQFAANDCDSGTPIPLDLNMAAAGDEPVQFNSAPLPANVTSGVPVVELLFEDGLEDLEAGADGEVAEPQAKRRRRQGIILDEPAEIPRDIYQAHVNDRSAITRNNSLDYAVWLPHHSPSLPEFTTTFTDLCDPLAHCLRLGAEMAEKRRRVQQELEIAGRKEREPKVAELDVSMPAQLELVPPVVPPEMSGPKILDVHSLGSKAPVTVTVPEDKLLEGAPTSMDGVITGDCDEEEQAATTSSRRTERMHKFLAQEFRTCDSDEVSFTSLCRREGAGRRELIAGCFFELLVLRTNGIVGLKEDRLYDDINISKAQNWAK